MAARKLVITKYKGYLISIVLDSEGKSTAIDAASPENVSMLGNIYAGNVTDVIKSINGAFVEIEDGVKGFLRLDDKSSPIFLNRSRNPGPVRQGDILLVQVSADPIKTKDAALTTQISISGRNAVLLSGEKGLKISSKIKSRADFRDLAAQVESKYQDFGFGFILRTAAINADAQSILKEMDSLALKWQQVLGNSFGAKKGLIMAGDSFFISKIKNGLGNEFDEIVSDDALVYKEVTEYLKREIPENEDVFKPYINPKVSLDVVYSIDKKLDEALNRIVHLKSGGFLVIEPTEAMCVIDVNSGKAVSRHNAQREYLQINLEAAKEIARQIMLRNLSGIIIVDFISMKAKEDNEALMKEMKDDLRCDTTKSTVVDMTGLGLVEITRKKVSPPLYEIINFC